MAKYELVRRKEDGLYKSVDEGFTADLQKAFVFDETTFSSAYLTDAYEILPLSPDQTTKWEAYLDALDNDRDYDENGFTPSDTARRRGFRL